MVMVEVGGGGGKHVVGEADTFGPYSHAVTRSFGPDIEMLWMFFRMFMALFITPEWVSTVTQGLF